jgi:hypothetical protein
LKSLALGRYDIARCPCIVRRERNQSVSKSLALGMYDIARCPSSLSRTEPLNIEIIGVGYV